MKTKIIKKSGRVEDFNPDKIKKAVDFVVAEAKEK